MGGGFLVVVVWAAVWVWAGRGLLLAEGWVAGALVSCLCGGGWGGWLPGAGIGNTPVVLLLPACVGSGVWWVPPRAWCVWGWHAVGVLGQCALVA